MANIEFLGEDNFLPVMDTENETWFRDFVKQGTLDSFDGTRLRYYYASPENPKGCVT